MNKMLKEARKGDDDNVISFVSVKPAAKPPGGPDWLRQLPFGTRFLAKAKGAQGQWLDSYGIGHIETHGILLATENTYGPGIAWKWVDSAVFSQHNIFVQILPPPEEIAEAITEEPDG